jgi:hypothetical protein
MREVADWARLGPLPRVGVHHREKKSRTWERARDKWAELSKTPLIVTAELVTPIIHAERDRTHLDSILSAAALTAHPVESDFGGAQCVIPLPLDLAWVSDSGQPLWACSPLEPVGETTESHEYWHKRYPGHRAELGSKMNAVTTAGRWKEYRVPMRVSHVDRLQALCFGDRAEIERLLGFVTHIGKKGSMGYGRVARWTVTEGSHSRDDVLSRRAVPIDYFSGREIAGVLKPRCGWTPPYWYAPWWAPCVTPPA